MAALGLRVMALSDLSVSSLPRLCGALLTDLFPVITVAARSSSVGEELCALPTASMPHPFARQQASLLSPWFGGAGSVAGQPTTAVWEGGAAPHQWLGGAGPFAGLLALEGRAISVAGLSTTYGFLSACPLPLRTSSGRSVSAACVGITAGILLFENTKSKDKSDKAAADTEIDTSELPEDGGDPMKTLLRLIKRIAEKFNRFPVPAVMKPSLLAESLEARFGKDVAGRLITAGKVLREKFSKLYIIVLTGMACVALKINLIDGCRIIKVIILEERQNLERKLGAYAIAANLRPEDVKDADQVVAVTFYDLATQQQNQMLILLDNDGVGAIRTLMEGLEKKQPTLRILERPSADFVMKALEAEATRKMQDKAKNMPGLDPAVKKLLEDQVNNLPELFSIPELDTPPATGDQAKPPATGDQAKPPATGDQAKPPLPK